MKATIPEELKDEVPQTKWGKILIATPVVLTVVATMLAGLSSSEMTGAQYNRSLAAQLQSKAGDQWALFQAKKLRGAMQRNTLDVLKGTSEVRDLDADAMEKSGGFDKSSLAAMDKVLLTAAPPPAFDDKIKTALEAVEHSKPESEVADALKTVDDKSLEAALQAAKNRAAEFDAAMQSAAPGFDQVEKRLFAADKSLARDFMAVRLGYAGLRYDAEARLNQSIAGIYELQVRKSNVEAERHRKRSARFFYGMLAAQMGVIISTFALAARKRSWLWTVAAAAGVVAITFAIYVYLCV